MVWGTGTSYTDRKSTIRILLRIFAIFLLPVGFANDNGTWFRRMR